MLKVNFIKIIINLTDEGFIKENQLNMLVK